MKEDLRVIKTKKAIEDAFISLVKTKGYKAIKLVDIAEKARINRNTIYLHYSSKEDIITSIVTGSINIEYEDFEMKNFIKIRFNRLKLEKFFAAVFHSLTKNLDVYRTLLFEDALIGFFEIEIKKIKKDILSFLKQTSRNEILVNYFVYGAFGIIQNYIVNGKENQQEVVRTLTDLTMATLRRVQL